LRYSARPCGVASAGGPRRPGIRLPAGRRTRARCCFLRDGDDHDPDLPSFPTRRSSDLTAAGRSGFISGERHAKTRAHALRRVNPDRKSTRLNSSHVKISYAVFCLKKKKKRATVEADDDTERLGTTTPAESPVDTAPRTR